MNGREDATETLAPPARGPPAPVLVEIPSTLPGTPLTPVPDLHTTPTP